MDGENVGGCGCSTPRHSDHISLSSSLGDLQGYTLIPSVGYWEVRSWSEWSGQQREKSSTLSQESNVGLGCFCVLAMVKTAAVNMSTGVCFH